MKNLLLPFFIIFFLISNLFAFNDMTLEENFTISDKLDIDINIDAGEIKVRQNEIDDQCHVRIQYNTDHAEADIRFNEKKNALDVIVDYDSWKSVGKDQEDHNRGPEILIELPSSAILDINAKLKAGEFDMRLGGLKIRSFQFTNWAGEADINFATPNQIEMETLDINFKVGELDIRNLGNARFKEADINSGIGELNIDFRGDMLERAMARIDLDIGETQITVPEEVGSKLRVSKFLFLAEVNYPHWFEKRGKYYYSENYSDSEKNLYLIISAGIGELSIDVK